MSIIETKKLSKAYGRQQALSGVDLSVEEGEIYGFIGPNGAGKSTTIRLLLGMLKKDGGEARVLGGDPWRDAVSIHRKLAYVPGDVTLWPNLSGGEVIDFLGKLQGNVNIARKKELLERFQLDPRKKCKSYSKGNRQKVALIAALASDAELFIFDEPTSGLDPLMEIVFQEYIKKIKRQGKTVFLSSHILSEVEAICDKVGIIRQGKIVEEGSMSKLRHLTRTTVSVELSAAPNSLPSMQGIYDLVRDNNKLRFSVDSDHMEEVMKTLTPLGIKALIAEAPTLEELFLRHYDEDFSNRKEKEYPHKKKGAI